MDYMATRCVRVSEGYYISGDRLAIRAITAEGSLQGIVGRWTDRSQAEELDTAGQVTKTTIAEGRYEFLADGTLTVAYLANGIPGRTVTGTWKSAGVDSYSV